MDWISQFFQTLQAVLQALTALLGATAALIAGIATFNGARARLRSRREKARGASSRAIPNKAAEKTEPANPKSNESSNMPASVQSPLPVIGLSSLTADHNKAPTELEQDTKQPP